MLLAVLAAGGTTGCIGATGGVISWRDAAEHYDEYVTVEGHVVDARRTEKVCFLNFHPHWREHFTAVIFARDYAKFPEDLEDAWLHRKVRVRGMVIQYEGRPEMILRSPRQIEIVE